MLVVASIDPQALRPEDEGFAKSIANVVGTAIARWRADAEVARLGLLDPLTGLANRPLFENRLQQALDRARREQGDAAVLFVDVDGFGKLNDGFGYRTGDEVLVGVGSRLAGVLAHDATAGVWRATISRCSRPASHPTARRSRWPSESAPRCASRCSPAAAS